MPDNPFSILAHSEHRPPVYRFHGLAVSMAVHLAAASVLLAVSVRPWYFDEWAAREARVLYVTTTEAVPEQSAESEVQVISDPSQVTESMVAEKIDRLAEEASHRSDEENLERLDQLAERLNEVASESSVDRMAGTLQTMLGTKARAERPAEDAVSGDFDFDTAQFHDIRREATDDGAARYLAILVDAEGRALEVEMNADDGQRVYQTMQRIKQNPLLEHVYRKIAMPLFDQMLAAARLSAQSARPVPPARSEPVVQDKD
jgi:hypothetical protein